MQVPGKLIPFFVSILLSATILFAGCDNPASNDDDHNGHSDPHGVRFIMNDEVILTYMDGDADGQFNVVEDQETLAITAEFLDEDGDEIHGEDLDAEFSLGWEVGNADLIGIKQHEEDGRWDFRMVGKSAGETTVQFKLMHGEHADFQTPGVNDGNALQVRVEEQSQ